MDAGERANAIGRPTGTVTFLFTDIVGSTLLWDAFPERMADALEVHDRLVRTAIATHGGHVFSQAGDSYAAAFAHASSAISAGLAAQAALAGERWPDGVAIEVRMGAHTGEAHERDGDYFGPVVNRAARLMGAANGGQLVVSGVTAALAPADDGVRYVDLGSVRVRGIVDPIDVVGVCGRGVSWVDQPLAGHPAALGNLRRPQTEFVGDLADLQRRIAALRDSRLVTLTGSGGVGKTRAAIEIGLLIIDDFPGGAWMCELAPITDPDAVVPAVIESIGARPQAGLTGVDVIVDWCHDRRVLLILDNCEHLVSAVADAVDELAQRCPTLTVLATSREPLGVPGERVVRVPSLDPVHGVELFVDRASALDSDFTEELDVASVEAICRRLDGIPLAIELAAARVRSLSPAEILNRLDERFRLLRGSGRGGLERHQTLQAAVDWSYRLLADEPRALFDELSVFAGSFDLDAVAAICDAGADGDVIDLLADLVDKSMVVAERAGRRTRYRLLETLRQYGEQRLADRDGTGRLRDRHLRHYAEASTRASGLLSTGDEEEAFAFFDDEWDNLRAALSWSIVLDDVTVAEQLLLTSNGVAEIRMRYEHADWAVDVGELGDRIGQPSALSLALQAGWAQRFGDPSRAVELAVTGAARSDDDMTVSICLVWQAEGLLVSGRTREALELIDPLRRVSTEAESTWMRMKARNVILGVLSGAGDPGYLDEVERARQFYEGTGSTVALSVFLFYRANGLLYLADPAEHERAHDEYRRSAEAANRIDDVQQRLWSEFGMVNARLLGGDLDIGAELHRVFAASHDARLWILTTTGLETVQLFHARRGRLDQAATILGFLERNPAPFETIAAPYRREVAAAVADGADALRCRQRGAAMDRHQLVAYALTTLSGS